MRKIDCRQQAIASGTENVRGLQRVSAHRGAVLAMAILAVCIGGAADVQTGLAQTPNAAGAISAADGSQLVCLANTVKGTANDGHVFVIAVPSDKVDGFVGRGFTPASCAQVQAISASSRQGLCRDAASDNRSVNLYFWQHFSMTMQEMCGTAYAVTQPSSTQP